MISSSLCDLLKVLQADPISLPQLGFHTDPHPVDAKASKWEAEYWRRSDDPERYPSPLELELGNSKPTPIDRFRALVSRLHTKLEANLDLWAFGRDEELLDGLVWLPDTSPLAKGTCFRDLCKSPGALAHLALLAVPSPFGDLKTQSTRMDPNKRRACEIRCGGPSGGLRVASRLCRAVEQKWALHMHPAQVRAVPDKLVCYQGGGHFRRHRDTPDKDMVGTFLLLGLHPRRSGGGTLTLYSADGNAQVVPAEKNWIAFYPEVEHMVDYVKADMRVALSFHIYAIDPKKRGREFGGEGKAGTRVRGR